MNNGIAIKAKELLKKYKAKHAVYGVINWKNEIELAPEIEFFYSDKSFNDYAEYLRKVKDVRHIYAVHAQD